jgi:hypothetical protein
MRRIFRTLALSACLAFLVSTLLAQDKDRSKSETKLDLTRLAMVSGTLENPGSDKGHLTLSIPYYEPQRRGRPVLKHRNVDLTPAEDMIVRTNFVPVEFDEKGKPRRRTQKELKELKGDPKLPGYQADASALKRGQQVTCYLEAKKKTGKKDDTDALVDNKPKVRLILITAEPPPS